jgi:cell division protein FtsI/penicillin-binding protein 2
VAATLCPGFCNAQLQKVVDRALSDSEGTIVVIDVASRKILAEKNLNLAAHDLVRPGSTVKPFVLAALLQTGRIDPKQKLVCKRPLRIGSVRIDCSHAADVRQLDTDDAIAYSCNSFVAEVSLRLKANELAETLRQAGLDSPTGLSKDEAIGRVRRALTQEQLQLMALGLRGVEVTPLELLEAYRKLAIQRVEHCDGAIREIYQGLEHAVSYGTAHAAYIEGMSVAGKTGTATTAQGSGTHGIFVGYAPAEHPEIAIVVYLDNSRGLDAAAVGQPVLAEYWRLKKKP